MGFPLSNLLERGSGGEALYLLILFNRLSQLDKQLIILSYFSVFPQIVLLKFNISYDSTLSSQCFHVLSLFFPERNVYMVEHNNWKFPFHTPSIKDKKAPITKIWQTSPDGAPYTTLPEAHITFVERSSAGIPLSRRFTTRAREWITRCRPFNSHLKYRERIKAWIFYGTGKHSAFRLFHKTFSLYIY